MNLHHSEWTGGLTALFHRFEVLCFGWDAQHDRILDDLLDAGLDAVYSDHVDRMVDALGPSAARTRTREVGGRCGGRGSAEPPAGPRGGSATPAERQREPQASAGSSAEARRPSDDDYNVPMSPGGQTRTKARPTMVSMGIGPR